MGTYTNDKLKNSYVNLRVLGKYPFTVGIAKLYPMAGFQFSFLASSKFDGEKVDLAPEYKKDLHHYYFLLGFGADIFATDNVFIRITPVFGFDMNKPEGYREAKKAAKDAGTKYSMQGYMFNHGNQVCNILRIKLGFMSAFNIMDLSEDLLFVFCL